jgi:hypothetical protein
MLNSDNATIEELPSRMNGITGISQGNSEIDEMGDGTSTPEDTHPVKRILNTGMTFSDADTKESPLSIRTPRETYQTPATYFLIYSIAAALIIPVISFKVVAQVKAAKAESGKWKRINLGVTLTVWIWGAADTAISSVSNYDELGYEHIYNICHGHVPFTADILAVMEGLVDSVCAFCVWLRQGEKGIHWTSGTVFAFGFLFTCLGLASSALSLKEVEEDYAFAEWYVGIVFFVAATAIRPDLWACIKSRWGRDSPEGE